MSLETKEQIIELINKSARILITAQNEPSGDAIASSIALKKFLDKKGKNSDIVISPQNPSKQTTSFLLGFNHVSYDLNLARQCIISINTEETPIKDLNYSRQNSFLNIYLLPESGQIEAERIKITHGLYTYDLAICLDAPDLPKLGEIFDNNREFFFSTPLINIDHHPDNENFGTVNLVEVTKSSIGELLYALFIKWDDKSVDQDIATCLLAGIIFKTHNFRSFACTPETLKISSDLMALGGDREEIVVKAYEQKEIKTLKLWGLTLSRLEHDLITGIAWSLINQDDFLTLAADSSKLLELKEEFLELSDQVKIIAILYHNPGSEYWQTMIYFPEKVRLDELLPEYIASQDNCIKIGTKRFAMIDLSQENGLPANPISFVELLNERMRQTLL